MALIVCGICFFLSTALYAADGKSTASLKVESAKTSETIKISSSSREKTLYWDTIVVKNGYGDLATVLKDFKLTITEQISPNNTLVTKYIATWKYHNYTEDDRNKTSVGLTITLLNAQKQPIDDPLYGSSPRDHCTDNPPWQDGNITEHTSKNNYFDLISKGTIDWVYSASYEGNC